ncbi:MULTISPECIES: zinc-dependent metalloprotease [Butyricimonas]|uniref:zinc-dependent metalloprotease n=1 Tax=Butyricimonas TaxID=574697 RepID=UPI0007FB4531|nr:MULTISPECIES: zinc-dependent metalloprotease [Butyricimonas]
MRKWIVWYVILLLILSCALPVEAIARKKKKVQVEKKELSKYDKLFQGKHVTSSAGEFVTLHRVNGKVYMEYPLKYMGREILLASTITTSTNGLVCTNGYKENKPMHLRVTADSSALFFHQVNALMNVDITKEKLLEVKQQNFEDPKWMRYDILTYSPDSSSVVIDMTNLFMDSEKALSPLPTKHRGLEIQATMNEELSSILEVKAFKDNASVKSQLVYRYSLLNQNSYKVIDNQPLTLVATRTLLLLPENKMKPRRSDLRLGTFLTSKREFTEKGEMLRYTYANRWDLQPRDIEAYRRGELVEPIKPIVFYLDTLFPASWMQPIRDGISRWNQAFEKIGFKNVVLVRDFPSDDPDFDPDNLKYSCIRYIPQATENAMGPSWVDPETGEILNASVFVYNNVIDMLRDWRFVQTAQVDESVRGKELPESVFNESLAYVIAHEIGHCLGLMHNMAASHAYPVDSLRSVSFTRTYGTTPSIMDYARFNYVAQTGDKGVRLTPPNLGVYDEFAIRWLYTPIYNASPEEEDRILEQWIDEKAGDPRYRFGRQQILSRYDPSAIEEDLGDDAVKSSEYGIQNLKYILSNLESWIKDDEDFTCRQKLYQQILVQYYRYIRNVIYNIGGIYLSDAKEESGIKRVAPVEKALQKASMRWIMTQLHDMAWLNERNLLKKITLSSLPSLDLTKAIGDVLANSYWKVALASMWSDDPYTLSDYFDDLYWGVWDSAITGRRLTREDQVLHQVFLKQMEENVRAIGGNPLWLFGNDQKIDMQKVYAPLEYDLCAYGLESGSENVFTRNFGFGYGWQPMVNTKMIHDTPVYYLEHLRRVRELLETKMDSFPSAEKDYYEMILYAVKQILGKQSRTK